MATVLNITSKQRAYLKSLAMNIKAEFDIGKDSLTPEFAAAIREAFDTHELIKISVLKNCADDPKEICRILSERTHSIPVQVIGRKIVLYKMADDPDKRKIVLPKEKKVIQ